MNNSKLTFLHQLNKYNIYLNLIVIWIMNKGKLKYQYKDIILIIIKFNMLLNISPDNINKLY